MQSKIDERHWDLSDLHDTVDVNATQPVLDTIFKRAHAFLEKYKGQVASLNATDLHAALLDYEAIKSDFYQISQFAHLNYAVDIKDPNILKFVSKIDDVGSQLSNVLLFFFLEIGAVSDACLASWLSADVLTNYKYPLDQAVKKHRYRLSEKEEQLINLKDVNGTDALRKLYGEHTAQYTFKVQVDGEEKTMNGSECRTLRYHKDPKVRANAMQTFFAQYQADDHIVTHLFNSIIKDYNIERSHRGYQLPIEPMNMGNDLPNDLVQMLHKVTTDSNHLVQDYYRLKQQILGLDTMTLADIYAPMETNPVDISWDDAKQTVLDSFKAFDADFYNYAKDMFDAQRLDVFPSKVKRGGAFCSSSHPKVRPYVMLNFLNKQRDVATLAHELGHAIHAYFSAEQPLINYHAILPVCETASVFSEMLVIDALKKQAKTPQERMVILSTKLEDIFATSHRQNMFSRFEQAAHDGIVEGRLSSKELCDLYLNELKCMFGDAVTITEEYHWEWSTIPHMLDVPFYVYSYNFGNLLVLGLYQLYLEEGASFVPKLKRILQAGSSKSPIQLLADEGIDICSESFWQGSIAFIANLLQELKDIVNAPDFSRS